MKILQLLGVSFTFALITTTASAALVGNELIADPDFNDPASWDVGIGASKVENGKLVVINHSGFIFPLPNFTTQIGETYQYTLDVSLVNNTAGGGKVTIGAQTIWEPGFDTGIFTGTVVATNPGGLVFNFLSGYTGRAEFNFISVQAVPLPAALWLFASGLLGLAGILQRKRSSLLQN
ncbi:MAG: VPLPA-CTERM sorting domain-containing protein [Thiotrichaceae bacterium]